MAPEFAAACLVATGGNPFFLRELVQALRADGDLADGGSGRSGGSSGSAECGAVGTDPDRGSLVRQRVRLRALWRCSVGRPSCVTSRHSAHSRRDGGIAIDQLRAAGVTVGFDPARLRIRSCTPRSTPTRLRRPRPRSPTGRHAASGRGAEVERVAAHLVRTRPVGDAWAAGCSRTRRARRCAGGRRTARSCIWSVRWRSRRRLKIGTIWSLRWAVASISPSAGRCGSSPRGDGYRGQREGTSRARAAGRAGAAGCRARQLGIRVGSLIRRSPNSPSRTRRCRCGWRRGYWRPLA